MERYQKAVVILLFLLSVPLYIQGDQTEIDWEAAFIKAYEHRDLTKIAPEPFYGEVRGMMEITPRQSTGEFDADGMGTYIPHPHYELRQQWLEKFSEDRPSQLLSFLKQLVLDPEIPDHLLNYSVLSAMDRLFSYSEKVPFYVSLLSMEDKSLVRSGTSFILKNTPYDDEGDLDLALRSVRDHEELVAEQRVLVMEQIQHRREAAIEVMKTGERAHLLEQIQTSYFETVFRDQSDIQRENEMRIQFMADQAEENRKQSIRTLLQVDIGVSENILITLQTIQHDLTHTVKIYAATYLKEQLWSGDRQALLSALTSIKKDETLNLQIRQVAETYFPEDDE